MINFEIVLIAHRDPIHFANIMHLGIYLHSSDFLEFSHFRIMLSPGLNIPYTWVGINVRCYIDYTMTAKSNSF
jgi:hypothetical protein